MSLVILGQSTNEEVVAGLEGLMDTVRSGLETIVRTVLDFFRHINILLFGYGGAAGDVGSIRAKLRSDRWKEFRARASYNFTSQFLTMFSKHVGASERSGTAVKNGKLQGLGVFNRLLNHGPLKSWSVSGVPEALDALCDQAGKDLTAMAAVTKQMVDDVKHRGANAPIYGTMPVGDTVKEYVKLGHQMHLPMHRFPHVQSKEFYKDWISLANHVASAYIGNTAPERDVIEVHVLPKLLDEVLSDLPRLVKMVDTITAVHARTAIEIQSHLTELDKQIDRVSTDFESGDHVKWAKETIRRASNVSRIAFPAIKMVVATQERILDLDKQIQKFAAEVS